MASQGPLSCGTGADDAGTGTVAWTNPSNITSSDNTYATASISTGNDSHYIKATNFGFTIPASATINGFTAEAEVSCVFTPGINVTDIKARAIKAGTIQGTDRSNATAWTTTDTYLSHGGAADLWGGTWTPADINDTGFGFALSATQGGGPVTAQVDHVRMTVFYTDNPVAGDDEPLIVQTRVNW